MPRWQAHVDFFTPARAVRRWEGEVEAETAAEACEKAVRAARREHYHSIAEIADVWVEPPDD